VDLTGWSRKEIGNLGEKVAAAYVCQHGLALVDRNVARKTGELDLIARAGETLHFIEVKTVVKEELPNKVARTAEWYVAETGWEGEWQVDGCLVWLRRSDGRARVEYLPQII
jgi:putative endonuclease